MNLPLLVALAMLAFAANSVLNRLALSDGGSGALGFAGVRLAAGALVLWLILRWRGTAGVGGTWSGALALAAYAVAFSLAYVRLGAANGALVLFATVQAGMLGAALWRGDRPGSLEWAGFLAAFAALGVFLGPGLAAPDPVGAALMAVAGLSWAAYSLIGRGSVAPLVDTAGNFLRCLPLALLLMAPEAVSPGLSAAGWAAAVASGAIASGLGYAIWYAALPALPRSTAAYVQLTVPVLAALGAVVVLAEPVTLRLTLTGGAVLAGVALALWAAERRRR